MDNIKPIDSGMFFSPHQTKYLCKQLLDSIPAALCIADRNGLIITANAELADTLSGNFVAGRSFVDLLGEEQRVSIAQKFEAVASGEIKHTSFALTFEDASGNVQHIDCSLSTMTCESVHLVVCRLIDRSLDRQLENSLIRAYSRLQLLTEGVHDVIMELSEDGRIVFASKEFNGKTKSQLHDLHITSLLPPELHGFWEIAFANRQNSEFKFKLRSETGFLHYSSRLKFINHGDVFAVFTVYDETESFNKTEELIENKKKLQQTIEAKDKFMSIIAHDLKAPFNALISFGQLLADTIQEGRYQRAERLINMINESAINSYNLLENLLTWSRSQQNHLMISPTSFSVSEAITDTFDMLKTVAISKKIKLVYENDMPQTLYADYNMIKTVLRNLIANALKFSYEGGTIRAGYRLINGAVEIYIRDEGVGMAEDVRKSLFTLKKPASLPGTKNEKGTGLGLLVCKEFVQLHKGTIYAAAPNGAGSEIRFSIPAAVRAKE